MSVIKSVTARKHTWPSSEIAFVKLIWWFPSERLLISLLAIPVQSDKTHKSTANRIHITEVADYMGSYRIRSTPPHNEPPNLHKSQPLSPGTLLLAIYVLPSVIFVATRYLAGINGRDQQGRLQSIAEDVQACFRLVGRGRHRFLLGRPATKCDYSELHNIKKSTNSPPYHPPSRTIPLLTPLEASCWERPSPVA